MIVLVGLLIGTILGLTGAGGAAFALPLLVLVIGLPVQQAIGLSLATVAMSAGYGALRRLNSGDIFWWAVACLSLFGMIAAPAGQYLSTYVPDVWLLAGFTVLSLGIASQMWRRCMEQDRELISASTSVGAMRSDAVADSPLFQFDDDGHFQPQARSVGVLALSGLGVGYLSGLFGVGGGFLIVPLLHLLIGVSMRQAIASSLLIITLISSAGFATHNLIAHDTDWNLLAQLGGGALVGMYLGSTLAERLSPGLLQKLFAICLLVLAVFTLGKVSIWGI
ncbi:MAG: sulfite exporter TauE/SafE family protein [Halieaceae bacterium]